MTLSRQRKSDLKRRLAEGRDDSRYCAVIGCAQLTTASQGKGLNRLYCRSHEDHRERHGSYIKRSYTAGQLGPHRAEALRALHALSKDPLVKQARLGIETLYATAGAPVDAFRTRGLTPEERARVTWARLRQSGVDPLEPLAAWLAVVAVIKADPQPDGRSEFLIVQAGKLIHRLAGGTHKVWQRERPKGGVEVISLHRYPASRGRVLRHVGDNLAAVAEPLELMRFPR
ncbi:hypothetical protein [uncultured Nevskia sp.]|uniref:hypothetical protein n=1 Tax=uncultured Nevskia sp. TaxID=228950 RepID=UPI0025D861DE|nr:hypothetical protein [uncultured Nevskia sp.]